MNISQLINQSEILTSSQQNKVWLRLFLGKMFEHILQIYIGILLLPGFETKSIQNKTDEEYSFNDVIAKLEDKIENLTRIINQGRLHCLSLLL